MKFSYVVVLVIFGLVVWSLLQNPPSKRFKSTWKEFHPPEDPAAALDTMVKRFPQKARPSELITRVSSAMEKKGPAGTPIEGQITFDGRLRYRFIFRWQDDRWIFTRFVCVDDGKDLLFDSNGQEILAYWEMQNFLEPHRRIGPTPVPTSAEELTAILKATATPGPAAAPQPRIPRNTPSPQETALDIAKKYGAPK